MEIIEIELMMMRSWPALEEKTYDGWIMRFSEGYTKRANSINPMYESYFDLEEKYEIEFDLLTHDKNDNVYAVEVAETENLIIQRLAKLPEITLIMVTHSAAALSITQRLVVLEQGRLLADGPTERLLLTSAKSANSA